MKLYSRITFRLQLTITFFLIKLSLIIAFQIVTFDISVSLFGLIPYQYLISSIACFPDDSKNTVADKENKEYFIPDC